MAIKFTYESKGNVEYETLVTLYNLSNLGKKDIPYEELEKKSKVRDKSISI